MVHEECAFSQKVVYRVASSQLRWFGHVKRISNKRLTRKIYLDEIEELRMRGRLKNKFITINK